MVMLKGSRFFRLICILMNANEKLTSQGTFENRKKLQLVFMIQTFLLPRPKESFKETNFTDVKITK